MTIPEIRAVIADDEPSARSRLRLLLESQPGVQVVAECADGVETVAAGDTHKPDLLLLAIHLPDSDGFEVLNRVPSDQRPITIFTSTDDQDAIRAFQARALDYLLKPFDAHRLRTAVERTRAEILKAHDRQLTHRLLNLLVEAKAESPMDRRLVVRAGGRVVFLDTDEIEWIEAAGNYVRLTAGGESYLMREGIAHISRRLDPGQFVRIHRSIIVNIRKIKELQPCNRGEYMVILKDGKELSCSRGYRARLQELVAAE